MATLPTEAELAAARRRARRPRPTEPVPEETLARNELERRVPGIAAVLAAGEGDELPT